MAEHDRLWHRMKKIARRLGDDPDPEIPPRKPKWMRSVTYDRLLGAWHEAAEQRDAIFDAKIADCIARLERLEIADANGGTRASGRPGHDASARLVEGKPRATAGVMPSVL
jgi:hypothetical protein